MFMKNKFPLMFVLLFTVFVLGACSEKQYTDLEHINRAMDFYDQEEIPSAVIELKNALKKNPQNAEARWHLGKLYVELGAGADAEKELQRAIELGVNDPNTKLQLYESYILQGKYAAVIADLKGQRFENDGALSQAFILLGRANLGLKQLVKARSWFEKAERLTNNVAALEGYASIAVLEGQYDEAQVLVDKVIALAPDNIEIHHVAGQLYQRKKDYAKAIESFDIIVAKIPGNVFARLNRAEVYVALGDMEKAEADVNVVLQMNDRIPLAHFIQAKVFYSRKQYKKAQESLDHVLRGLPNHLPSFFMLGIAHAQLGNLLLSEYYLKKFLNSVKHHPEAEKLLVEAYFKLSQINDALPLLERLKAQQAVPDLMVMTALAEGYLQAGQAEKAIESYKEAIGLWPDRKFLKARLVVAYLQAGQKDIAISQLKPLAEVDNGDARAQMLLINTYIDAGNVAEGVALAARLVERGPESEVNHFIQGYTFTRTGKIDEAIQSYQRSLDINAQYTPSLLGSGSIYTHQGKFEKAKGVLRKVLAINEKHLASMLTMAEIDKHLKNYDSAHNWYSKAAALSPNAIEPVKGLVSLDLLQNEPLNALSRARSFEQAQPDNRHGMALLALALIANGEYANAAFYLRRYTAVSPKDFVYRTLLADLLNRQGDKEAALKEVTTALSIRQDYLPGLYRKISLLVDLQRFAEARMEIEVLKALDQDIKMGRLLGDLYFKEGRLKDSIDAYQVAYGEQPDSQLLRSLINAMVRNGQLSEAADFLTEQLRATPGDAVANGLLANLWVKMGDTDKAITAYEAVLQVSPNNMIALNNLAWLYLDHKKDIDRALNYAEQASQVVPDEPNVKDTLAWVLSHSGGGQRALEMYEQLVNQYPQQVQFRYHYAVVLFKIGQVERSKEVLHYIENKYPNSELLNDLRSLIVQ